MAGTDTSSENRFAALEKEFGSEILGREEHRGDLTLVVKKEKIREIIRFLKHDPFLRFEIMMDLFGMDYLQSQPSESRFAVIYNMVSLQNKLRLRIKVPLSENAPEIDSIYEIYSAANWFEREAWDLFGIQFKGHPNLVRILCHHDFEGHPLRKDYPSDQYQRLKTAAPSTGF